MSDLFLLALPLQPHQIVMEDVTLDTLADEEYGVYILGAEVHDPVTAIDRPLSREMYRTADGRVCVKHDGCFAIRVYILIRVRFLDEHGDVRAFTLSKLTKETPLLPGAVIVGRMNCWIYESVMYSTIDVYEGHALRRDVDGQNIIDSRYIRDWQMFTPDALVLHTVPCMADYELK